MILIEIVLAIAAWKRGWRWYSLLPIAGSLLLAFFMGMAVGLTGGDTSRGAGMYVIGDVLAVIALFLMCARKRVPNSATNISEVPSDGLSDSQPGGALGRSLAYSDNDWLPTVLDRLSAAGFTVSKDVRFGQLQFALVARRTRFEFTKFGFVEQFYVFQPFQSPDHGTLRAFSTAAFKYSKQTREIPLPCGFFEAVSCFAIAMTNGVDKSTCERVRTEAPAAHWAAFELPIIYDHARQALHYFEGTPLWGAAYYAGMRKQIRQMLQPTPSLCEANGVAVATAPH